MTMRTRFLALVALLLMPVAASAVRPIGLDLSFAPEIVMRDSQGQTFKLSQFRGHMVAVHFWASWCVPCRTEIPAMAAFMHNNPNAVVLPLSLDSNPRSAMAFLDQTGASIPLMFTTRQVAASYGVRAIPTTIIIDRDGRLLYKISGAAPWRSRDFRNLMLGFAARLP